MTTDLTTWLLEQIAEDEQIAALATRPPWVAKVDDVETGDSRRYAAVGRIAVDVPGRRRWLYAGGENGHDARHIAAWDPARVLAECEAKRQILEYHEPETLPDGIPTYDPPRCDSCTNCELPCPTLRLLAVPYADRAGYREEWRP